MSCILLRTACDADFVALDDSVKGIELFSGVVTSEGGGVLKFCMAVVVYDHRGRFFRDA